MSYFKVFIGVVAVYWVMFCSLFIAAGTLVHFAFGLSWFGVVVSSMVAALAVGLWRAFTADYSELDIWM
jgi:hypothetical protein